MKYTLYIIARPIITLFMKLFYKVEIINKENIRDKNALLVGNHTSNLDALLVISSTKRNIRFLAKQELFKPVLKKLFLNAGVIPVNRKQKSPLSISLAETALNNNELVCIFPEGTINKTNNTLLPFKYGSVSLASKTSSLLVPFVIKGKYKLFRKSVSIKFLSPYYLETNNLELENNKLMKKIEKELIK